ncbi:MAG: hypothetical protein K2X39_06160, partial [Silvanigrellaceae bacterium]|nr:hypothetical protein [Silvanigrellaceae bacterium]
DFFSEKFLLGKVLNSFTNLEENKELIIKTPTLINNRKEKEKKYFYSFLRKLINITEDKGYNYRLNTLDAAELCKELNITKENILNLVQQGFDHHLLNMVLSIKNDLETLIKKPQRTYAQFKEQNQTLESDISKSHEVSFYLKANFEQQNHLKYKAVWIAKKIDDLNDVLHEEQKYVEAISGDIYRLIIGVEQPKYKLFRNQLDEFYIFSKSVNNFRDNPEVIYSQFKYYKQGKNKNYHKNLAKIALASVLLAESDLRIGNLVLTEVLSGCFNFIKIDHDFSFTPLYEKNYWNEHYQEKIWGANKDPAENPNFAITSDDILTFPNTKNYIPNNFLLFTNINPNKIQDNLILKNISTSSDFIKEKNFTITKILVIPTCLIKQIIHITPNIPKQLQEAMFLFYEKRVVLFKQATLNVKPYLEYLKTQSARNDLVIIINEVIEFLNENSKYLLSISESRESYSMSWVKKEILSNFEKLTNF